MSSEHQNAHQVGLLREIPELTTCHFVSLEGAESIVALWYATGTDGDVAGASSSKWMICGATGDTGDTCDGKLATKSPLSTCKRIACPAQKIEAIEL